MSTLIVKEPRLRTLINGEWLIDLVCEFERLPGHNTPRIFTSSDEWRRLNPNTLVEVEYALSVFDERKGNLQSLYLQENNEARFFSQTEGNVFTWREALEKLRLELIGKF